MTLPAAELTLGTGRVSLSPLPGRGGDLAGDLRALQVWGADLVVSLTESHELAPRGLEDIETELARFGIAWMPLPIADFGIPAGSGHRASLGAIFAELRAGRRVALHCMGGCGRSGMIALRLMLMAGEGPARALARLRKARPCAIETEVQLAWALDLDA